MKRAITAELTDDGWAQIDRFLREGNGPNHPEPRTVDALVEQLLAAWADGFRRPGSWERTMLDMMGHT